MATRRDRKAGASVGHQGVRAGVAENQLEYPTTGDDPLDSIAHLSEPTIEVNPSPRTVADDARRLNVTTLDYVRTELRKIWNILQGFEAKGKLNPLSKLGSFLDQEGRVVSYYDPELDQVVRNTNLAKLDGNNTFTGNNTFNGSIDIAGTFSANTLSLDNGLNVTGNAAITGTLNVIGAVTFGATLDVSGNTDVNRIDYTKAAPDSQTLTSATTVSLNFNQGDHKVLTLGHNVTFENPTGDTTGQCVTIVVTGHASTTYTVSWDTQFKFPGGTAPVHPGPNAIDVYTILVKSSSEALVVASQDFS
jgi:hypothetical protein